MAYVLLSQSFGISKANLPVTITDTLTGVPAVILSSATGGLLNSNGDAQLDASGNLAVYVDGDKAWSINVDSGASPSPVGLLNSVQITAGAVGIPGVKADGTLLSPQGTLAGLSAAQIASLGAISVTGRDFSNRITSYTAGGSAFTITYDSVGRIGSYTVDGVTKNLAYSVSGYLTTGEI